jgi:hypothetical protein
MMSFISLPKRYILKPTTNWIIYYCHNEDYHGVNTLKVHAYEVPDSFGRSREQAQEEWSKAYKPVHNRLMFLGVERVPDGWYGSGGQAYYAERVAILRGHHPDSKPRGNVPEVGLELYREEHTGKAGYDGDKVMDAVRELAKASNNFIKEK